MFTHRTQRRIRKLEYEMKNSTRANEASHSNDLVMDAEAGRGKQKCPTCEGWGKVGGLEDSDPFAYPCPKCEGAGELPINSDALGEIPKHSIDLRS